MAVYFKALYKITPPPGEPIHVLVAPFEVKDGVPSAEEVEDAVLGLKSKKAPGPTGMRAEHLKEWLAAARKEVNPDIKCWDSLVELIQHVFEKGEIPKKTAWLVLVLIPKGSGGCRGIGLLEIVWKPTSNFMILYTGLEILGGQEQRP
jgi:hypothetical protein